MKELSFYGMLFALPLIIAGLLMISLKLPNNLAVVDMQELISNRTQSLAKEPGKKISLQQVQALGDQLKEELHQFASRHNLILLTKGAVMGGDLPDYTDQILKTLERGERR